MTKTAKPQMSKNRGYLLLLALVPFGFGIDLLSGQNLSHFGIRPESNAVLLGLLLELFALGLVVFSRVRWAKYLACFCAFLMALLLVGWGIVVAMFSGSGDGASVGAKPSDVLVWFGAGIACLAATFVAMRFRFPEDSPKSDQKHSRQ